MQPAEERDAPDECERLRDGRAARSAHEGACPPVPDKEARVRRAHREVRPSARSHRGHGEVRGVGGGVRRPERGREPQERPDVLVALEAVLQHADALGLADDGEEGESAPGLLEDVRGGVDGEGEDAPGGPAQEVGAAAQRALGGLLAPVPDGDAGPRGDGDDPPEVPPAGEVLGDALRPAEDYLPRDLGALGDSEDDDGVRIVGLGGHERTPGRVYADALAVLQRRVYHRTQQRERLFILWLRSLLF